jgi:hypothetical protein
MVANGYSWQKMGCRFTASLRSGWELGHCNSNDTQRSGHWPPATGLTIAA